MPCHAVRLLLGITHGWAIIWALSLGLGLVELLLGPLDVIYKSTGAAAGEGIEYQITEQPTGFPFLSTAVHLCPLDPLPLLPFQIYF